jgi:PPOX class probable F420-dependent enzyme
VHEPTVERARVAASQVARLATVRPDGRPHLVPIVYALDGDTLYSAVDAKPKRSRALQRLENVRAHPEVAVLVDHYEDNWDELWWVRLDGAARVLEEGAEADRAIELLCAKYPQYRDAPPRPPVLAIDVVRWSGWTSSSRLVGRGRSG